MRPWLVLAVSMLVLGTSAVELIHTALDPALSCAAADGDDESCPPFSDDCQDCAQCVHWNALPPVLVGVLPLAPPGSLGEEPSRGAGRTPTDAPADEILTVPRA